MKKIAILFLLVVQFVQSQQATQFTAVNINATEGDGLPPSFTIKQNNVTLLKYGTYLGGGFSGLSMFDRNGKERIAFQVNDNAAASFFMKGANDVDVMKLFNEETFGNDSQQGRKWNVLQMPQAFSRLTIGNWADYKLDDNKYANTKLVVSGHWGDNGYIDASALVEGDIYGKTIQVEHSVPNGNVYANEGERLRKGLLLGAGKDTAGEPLLAFYDAPSGIVEGKAENSKVWFDIEDRNDMNRMRVIATENGPSWMAFSDKTQTEYFSLYDPGDKYAFLHMKKPDSYLLIGGFKEWNDWDRKYKLNIWDGSANIEGDIVGQRIKLDNKLEDGIVFESSEEMWEKSLLVGAGVDSSNNPMFAFYDFPERTVEGSVEKASIRFHIEDRNDVARLRLKGDIDGQTIFKLFDNKGNNGFEVYMPDDDRSILNMAKQNSHVIIGAQGVPNDLSKKLVVKNGDALFEGNIFSTGNVAIGTETFEDNGQTYKLSVKGKVRADEVKVYTNWADYVFHDNYQLPTLKEVEKHIKENGHLKDIPSAKEVEENGIQLGEMNKLLLQKIEELTLYTIQLKKEIDELKAEK